MLRFGFRTVLGAAPSFTGRTTPPRRWTASCSVLTCSVLALVFVGFVAGLNLAWTALAGGALIMVLARRDTHEVLKLVDWHLLVFFAALFVVVEGLNGTGLPDQIYARVQRRVRHVRHSAGLEPGLVLGAGLERLLQRALRAGGRQMDRATSPNPELMWKVMALATTFAGNLTILGSVANIIVVESARGHVEVGFWDYARFGIPVTLLTTAAGMGVLLLLH